MNEKYVLLFMLETLGEKESSAITNLPQKTKGLYSLCLNVLKTTELYSLNWWCMYVNKVKKKWRRDAITINIIRSV